MFGICQNIDNTLNLHFRLKLIPTFIRNLNSTVNLHVFYVCCEPKNHVFWNWLVVKHFSKISKKTSRECWLRVSFPQLRENMWRLTDLVTCKKTLEKKNIFYRFLLHLRWKLWKTQRKLGNFAKSQKIKR